VQHLTLYLVRLRLLNTLWLLVEVVEVVQEAVVEVQVVC
jgi:hypothetical protein